jgi:hypothetical protein
MWNTGIQNSCLADCNPFSALAIKAKSHQIATIVLKSGKRATIPFNHWYSKLKNSRLQLLNWGMGG